MRLAVIIPALLLAFIALYVASIGPAVYTLRGQEWHIFKTLEFMDE